MQVLSFSLTILSCIYLTAANFPFVAQAPHLRHAYGAPIIEKVAPAIVEHVAAPIIAEPIVSEIVVPGSAPVEADHHGVHEVAYKHDHDSGYKLDASDNVNVAGYAGHFPGYAAGYGAHFPGFAAGYGSHFPHLTAGYGAVGLPHYAAEYEGLYPGYNSLEYGVPAVYESYHPEYVSSYGGAWSNAHYYPSVSAPVIAAKGY